ncbi:hypothetical protein FRC07_011095 [Ceratobasidium sp. 392]|nr:hypothetical protein FRC07_011095 [Ceratobasidium sp. 392]
MGTLFTTVEQYDLMTAEYLRYSKIGKVMRRIAYPSSMFPNHNAYGFTERAQVLVAKWQQLMGTAERL